MHLRTVEPCCFHALSLNPMMSVALKVHRPNPMRTPCEGLDSRGFSGNDCHIVLMQLHV